MLADACLNCILGKIAQVGAGYVPLTTQLAPISRYSLLTILASPSLCVTGQLLTFDVDLCCIWENRLFLVLQLVSTIKFITQLNYKLCVTNFEERYVADLFDLCILPNTAVV